MNSQALIALAAAGGAAIADWIAVLRRQRWLEYAAKPLTMAALIAVAAFLQPTSRSQQAWFLAALGLSLLGDIGLLVDRWSADRRGAFLAGLAAFAGAHVAYIGGFAALNGSLNQIGVPLLAVGAVTVAAGQPILKSLGSGARRHLMVPVSAYMMLITVMTAAAMSSGRPLAGLGAALFFLSDFLIARDRFVRKLRWGPPVVIVTYHVGQALLVLSLPG